MILVFLTIFVISFLWIVVIMWWHTPNMLRANNAVFLKSQSFHLKTDRILSFTIIVGFVEHIVKVRVIPQVLRFLGFCFFIIERGATIVSIKARRVRAFLQSKSAVTAHQSSYWDEIRQWKNKNGLENGKAPEKINFAVADHDISNHRIDD